MDHPKDHSLFGLGLPGFSFAIKNCLPGLLCVRFCCVFPLNLPPTRRVPSLPSVPTLFVIVVAMGAATSSHPAGRSGKSKVEMEPGPRKTSYK